MSGVAITAHLSSANHTPPILLPLFRILPLTSCPPRPLPADTLLTLVLVRFELAFVWDQNPAVFDTPAGNFLPAGVPLTDLDQFPSRQVAAPLYTYLNQQLNAHLPRVLNPLVQ